MRFQLDDKIVDTVQGKVISEQGEKPVRAKTLQVLNYLIENSHHVVTKKELLDAVWSDVVVQDQVLTQSVKEIRDLLGASVIKTYPRKGYQWVAPIEPEQSKPKVTLQSAPVLDPQSEIQSPQQALPKESVLFGLGSKSVIALGLGFLMTALAVFYVLQGQGTPLRVAFLPVKNDMQDSVHNWVPLKGLEHLSKGLVASSELAVIDSDHVLYAIERMTPDALATYQGGRVYPLQQKLDAEVIVQTRLTGFPKDFQLHYELHSKYGVEQGIELAASVEQAFDQLVATIAKRYDQYQPQTNAQSYTDFSNEAFARGVALYLQQDYDKALPLLEAALQIDANLLPARRYKAGILANQGRVDEAITALKINIDKADQQNKREQLRAYLMIGYLQLNFPNYNSRSEELLSAEQHISKAKALAEQQQDQLFIAYSYEELGKVKRLQGHYSEAIRLLTQALGYHKQFKGDYGQTAALIQLAKVAAEQGEFTEAERYLDRAQEIADSSDAAANQVWVLLAKADLAKGRLDNTQAQAFANQAKHVAERANNPTLIARVQAWSKQSVVYTVN